MGQVTEFVQDHRPCDAWQTNQLKWYSTSKSWSYKLQQWVLYQTHTKSSDLVFTSPVYRTGNIHRTKLDWTSLFPVAVAHIWGQFSCQLPCFCRYLKTDKDRSRLVATGLSSHHMLDLTHTHIYLIFGPWIIKNGQELVEIWPKTFLYAYFVVNLPDL